MTDLPQRLREVEAAELEVANSCDCRPEDTANYRYAEVCRNAADEIERLREFERKWIAEICPRCGINQRRSETAIDF